MSELRRVFEYLTDKPAPFSEAGLRQFVAFDSRGVVPEAPDPYYVALRSGKHHFGIMQAMLRADFFTNDRWCGLRQLSEDWGERRWMLRYLLAWYPNLPAYVWQGESKVEAA